MAKRKQPAAELHLPSASSSMEQIAKALTRLANAQIEALARWMSARQKVPLILRCGGPGPPRLLVTRTVSVDASVMSQSDIEQVLRNWIDHVISPAGKFPEGTDRARWVVENFIAWWRKDVEDSLGSAEFAAHRLRDEVMRLGIPAEIDEVLHELTHVQDALGDLRQNLGLSGDAANGE